MKIKTLIEIYEEETEKLKELLTENSNTANANICIKIEARIEIFQEVIQDLKNIQG